MDKEAKLVQKPSATLYLAAASALLGAIGKWTAIVGSHCAQVLPQQLQLSPPPPSTRHGSGAGLDFASL